MNDSHNAEKDAGLVKRDDETQTAFAIRCVKAEAWDEGNMHICHESRLPCSHNPYRPTPPERNGS